MGNRLEASIWVARAEASGQTVLEQFAYTINRLPIKEEGVKGDILIGGQGPAFPERVLVCGQDSNFREMRPTVNSLTCCDSEFFTNPQIRIKHPVKTLLPGHQPRFQKESVNYYLYSLQEVLPYVSPESFDTALFFRICEIQEQFQTGLLTVLKHVLKKGALLIGSGSFDDMGIAQKILEKEFIIIAIRELPKIDYSGFAYKTHVGFILEKPH